MIKITAGIMVILSMQCGAYAAHPVKIGLNRTETDRAWLAGITWRL